MEHCQRWIHDRYEADSPVANLLEKLMVYRHNWASDRRNHAGVLNKSHEVQVSMGPREKAGHDILAQMNDQLEEITDGYMTEETVVLELTNLPSFDVQFRESRTLRSLVRHINDEMAIAYVFICILYYLFKSQAYSLDENNFYFLDSWRNINAQFISMMQTQVALLYQFMGGNRTVRVRRGQAENTVRHSKRI